MYGITPRVSSGLFFGLEHGHLLCISALGNDEYLSLVHISSAPMAETGQRRHFSHLLSMCWKGWTLWWTYLALARLVHSQDQIKVLTSLLRLEDVGEGINGAKLINTLVVNVTDLTICIRFNLKVLGKNEGRSRIITIEDWREDGSVRELSLYNYH